MNEFFIFCSRPIQQVYHDNANTIAYIFRRVQHKIVQSQFSSYSKQITSPLQADSNGS